MVADKYIMFNDLRSNAPFTTKKRKTDIKELLNLLASRFVRGKESLLTESEYLDFAKKSGVKVCKVLGVDYASRIEMQHYYGLAFDRRDTGLVVKDSKGRFKNKIAYTVRNIL